MVETKHIVLGCVVKNSWGKGRGSLGRLFGITFGRGEGSRGEEKTKEWFFGDWGFSAERDADNNKRKKEAASTTPNEKEKKKKYVTPPPK